MTYAATQVSYWVGQANDTSGGPHPPGWTSGQRWSETSTEWMNDRNYWVGQATDTSGGAHPPGWGNGQLWSTTATQWMNDRNTWYNQAQAWYTSRYNDGYGAGYAAADAAESPRALATFNFTGTIPVHNGTLQPITIGGSGDGAVITNNGPSLTAHRPGYYMIAAFGSGYNNVGIRVFTEGALRAENNPTPNAQDWLPGIGCQWVGFINAGGALTFQGRSQTGAYGANITVTFIPSPGYQQ